METTSAGFEQKDSRISRFMERQPWIIRFVINLLIALAAIAVSLVVLEGIIRVVTPNPPPAPENKSIKDPVLGWRMPPNMGMTSETPDHVTRVTTNSHGWRDVEHTYDKPEGTFRILILGDSYIQAASVEMAEQLSRQLEDMVKASGRENVEVISMGASGYGTLQEYLVFDQEGRLYHPDLVLLAFHPDNDLIDNSISLTAAVSGEDSPQFYRRPFLLAGSDEDWQIQPPDFEQLKEAKSNKKPEPFWKRTELYSMISDALSIQAGAETVNMLYRCDELPAVHDAWETTNRIFRRFDDAAQQAGARLVIFTVPSRVATDSSYVTLMLRGEPDPSAFCYDSAPPYARFESVTENDGIMALNLLPAFRTAQAEEGVALSYTESDAHWNPEGHRLAAQLLLDYLVQQHLLP